MVLTFFFLGLSSFFFLLFSFFSLPLFLLSFDFSGEISLTISLFEDIVPPLSSFFSFIFFSEFILSLVLSSSSNFIIILLLTVPILNDFLTSLFTFISLFLTFNSFLCVPPLKLFSLKIEFSSLLLSLIIFSKMFKFSFLYFCSIISISFSFIINFWTFSLHNFKYLFITLFLLLLNSIKHFKLYKIFALFGS